MTRLVATRRTGYSAASVAKHAGGGESLLVAGLGIAVAPSLEMKLV